MVEVNLPEADMSSGKYTEYNFDTANHFYDVLLNLSHTLDKSLWRYEPAFSSPRRWIFRGHWESSWELLPKAFRPESYKNFRLKPVSTRVGAVNFRIPQITYLDGVTFKENTTPNDKIKEQIQAEFFLLRHFMETANSLGIECNYTPHFYTYGHMLRDAFTAKDMNEIKKWPDSSLLSVMALAQHHGLPTRLLDFSYNPLFAAFFAASEPFEKNFNERLCNKNLCIWAIDEKNNEDIIGTRPNSPWRKIPAPSNRSSNLFAQEGLLIQDTLANKRFMDNDGEWQDFISMEKTDGFLKLTLPQNKCKDLLRLLWNNDITPARVRPNLDRVTQNMEYKQWLWIK